MHFTRRNYKITSLLQNPFRFLVTIHIPLDRSNCEQGSNLDPNFTKFCASEKWPPAQKLLAIKGDKLSLQKEVA